MGVYPLTMYSIIKYFFFLLSWSPLKLTFTWQNLQLSFFSDCFFLSASSFCCFASNLFLWYIFTPANARQRINVFAAKIYSSRGTCSRTFQFMVDCEFTPDQHKPPTDKYMRGSWKVKSRELESLIPRRLELWMKNLHPLVSDFLLGLQSHL